MQTPLLTRRRFLERSLLAGGGAMAALALPAARSKAAPARTAVYYIPGTGRPNVFYEGVPVTEHPHLTRAMRPIVGRPCLLTRVSEADGSVDRVVLPVIGHSVSLRPDGRSAVLSGKRDTLVTFDPQSLDLQSFLEFEPDIRGSGHAVYLPDTGGLASAECRPMAPYSGRPEDHYGRIAIRDPDDLQMLAEYSSAGMFPHEIALLADGAHLAVANYGSSFWPRGSRGFDRYHVEPCVAVLELVSGRVVDRYVGPPVSEFRHVAAHDRRRIFVLQNAQIPIEAYREAMGSESELPAFLRRRNPRAVEGSLPLLHFDFEPEGADSTVRSLAADSTAMFRGQSVLYDPIHEEVIATYTFSQTIVAFSAADGHVKAVVRTDQLGLRDPRGLTLHPDGHHYAVAGADENLFVFERGSHALVRERCYHGPTYEVAHIKAA